MKPQAIMSMQSTQSGKQASDQQQAPAPKRSTASLNKMPGMYSTPAQVAAGRRQRPD